MNLPFTKTIKRLRATQKDYHRALDLLLISKQILETIDSEGYTCPLCGCMYKCSPKCKITIALEEINKMNVGKQLSLNGLEAQR